jgi:integrase
VYLHRVPEAPPLAPTDYLKLRHNTWYVRVQIPRHLWAAAGGRREYIKSLKTGDLHEANRLKHAHVAAFQRRIKALEREKPDDPLADLYDKALAWREAMEKYKGKVLFYEGPEEDKPYYATDEFLSQISDEAREFEETHGEAAAERFSKIAKGEGTPLRDDLIDAWLTEQDHITQQTRVQHRAAVRAFIAWAGGGLTIEEITRRRAGEYVRSLAPGSSFSRKTAQRHVSSLSSLWTWLVARGQAEEENPWLRQGLGRKTTRGQAPQCGQWEDAALVKLLTGEMTPQYTETLHDLIRLALVTGARLGELCALRTTDVNKEQDGWWITIREGKTRAAVREVPIHESAAHVLERRRDSADGFVFPGLVPGGPDKQRSWNASKAFTRYRRKLGLSAPGQVFHSLRRTFIEVMEAAAVPESTVALIVGHKRASLTYGHYSKGQRVNLREAINALRYRKEVMRLISGRPSQRQGDHRKAASGEAAAAAKQATRSKKSRTPRRGARRGGAVRNATAKGRQQ